MGDEGAFDFSWEEGIVMEMGMGMGIVSMILLILFCCKCSRCDGCDRDGHAGLL